MSVMRIKLITKVRKIMPQNKLKREDLIYPELSYKIVGILFNTGKEVGFGHKENFYQKALMEAFRQAGLEVKEQVPIKMYYRNKFIGIYYLDFLIENKIILEIKSKSFFSKKDIDQIYSYLKAGNMKLGILAHFTRSEVLFKRILNLS